MVKNLCVSFLLLISVTAFAQTHRKIVILTASFGEGHNTAARVMKNNLLKADPNVEIVWLNVEEVALSPGLHKWEIKHYNFVTQFIPWFYRFEYKLQMLIPLIFQRYAVHGFIIDPEKLSRRLHEIQPDLIASSYIFAAGSVIYLRDKGLIPKEIPILLTPPDFSDETFYFRHAERLDMNFVASDEIADQWISRGLDPSKIAATGMLVAPEASTVMTEDEKATFRSSKGLRSDVPIVAISGGGQGMVDYKKIIESILKNYNGPIQLVALTGYNAKKKQDVEAMDLPSNVFLKTEAFIPYEEMIKYAKSSSVYIAKPGGPASTEAARSRAVTVLVNIMGAQEQRTANYFENTKMALVTKNQSRVGEKVASLLNDPKLAATLYGNTAKMKEAMHPERITDYILKSLSTSDTRAGAWERVSCQAKLTFMARLFSKRSSQH